MEKIVSVLPKEKPENAVGRPIVPFRKVMDGILYILRTGCQWKMLPAEGMVPVPHAIEDFRNGLSLDIFKKMWIRLLKTYDDLIGIKWTMAIP